MAKYPEEHEPMAKYPDEEMVMSQGNFMDSLNS